MTSNNIDRTLISALPAGATSMYPAEYLAVLNALVQREFGLTDQIIDVVNREFGTDKDTIRQQLVMAGFDVRPLPAPVAPEPVVDDLSEFEKSLASVIDVQPATVEAPVAKKAKKSKKDKTAKLVRRLVKAAERHGISI